MTPLPEPQAGASARPWRTDRTDIFDAYGNKIASVSGSETQLDDAALIVQAVNAFELAIQALSEARNILQDNGLNYYMVDIALMKMGVPNAS